MHVIHIRRSSGSRIISRSRGRVSCCTGDVCINVVALNHNEYTEEYGWQARR